MFGNYRGAVIAVVASVLSACGGGSAITPTAPTTPTTVVPPQTTTPVLPTVPTASQWQVGILFGFATADFTTNLVTVEFTLDGTIEERQTFSSVGTASAGLFMIKPAVSPGRHVFAARVVNQVRTPQTYELYGLGTLARGFERIEYECPVQRVSVTTGGQMSCSFTLPQ